MRAKERQEGHPVKGRVGLWTERKKSEGLIKVEY